DFMKFLIQDGGYYDCAGHMALLAKAFPKTEITIKRIRSLRKQICSSSIVKYDFIIAKSRQKAMRVIFVDPRYEIHAISRPAGRREKITDSYIRSEPPEVVRQMLLVQQFNKLLAPVTHHRAY
ncbi:MAG: hypothetical protein WCD24_15465, partial [Serratia inhibens]|uniref:hypothetical protein n=1 Tax=Serratia inhibens TaxID=2338073 RepID=UPI003C7E6044